MSTIIFEGKEIEFDKNGYLVDFQKWTRKLAVKMAQESGFKNLGDDKRHWSVLELLRDLYQKNMLPSKEGELIFLITKGTGLSLPTLHRMFDGLSTTRLLKWAGLPAIYRPTAAPNN